MSSMSDMQRWTASYRFSWAPIITFAMRRIKLLEWYEENLEPLAFNDSADQVGIAISSRSLRLTVSQSGVQIENGDASRVATTEVARALGGVLEVMEPRRVKVRDAAHAISVPTSIGDYEAAARSFARRLTGISDDDFHQLDASGLADLAVDGWKIQPEWGYVTADEVVERVSRPEITRGGALRPNRGIAKPSVDDLPPVSVFVDAFATPDRPTYVSDADGMIGAVEKVDTVMELLARSLASQMEKEDAQ